MTIVAAPVVGVFAPRAVRFQAANLAQVAAEYGRTLLGGRSDSVPAAGSDFQLRDLTQGVILTAYRDGRLGWRNVADSGEAVPDSGSGGSLLIRALDLARGANDANFFWPDGLAGDSLQFRIELRMPIVDTKGVIHPIRDTLAVPVFTIGIQREEPVVAVRPPRVHYPATPHRRGAGALIILEYVVNTDGRVDLATVRDVWPADRPRLTGVLGDYYQDFLKAVRSALAEARYSPARIAGCPVRQLIRQEFAFNLGH